jgi:hypothetical protein
VTHDEEGPTSCQRSPTYERSFTQRAPRAEWAPLPVRELVGIDSDAAFLAELSGLLREARRDAEGVMVFMTHDALATAIRVWRVRIDALLAGPRLVPAQRGRAEAPRAEAG